MRKPYSRFLTPIDCLKISAQVRKGRDTDYKREGNTDYKRDGNADYKNYSTNVLQVITHKRVAKRSILFVDIALVINR